MGPQVEGALGDPCLAQSPEGADIQRATPCYRRAPREGREREQKHTRICQPLLPPDRCSGRVTWDSELLGQNKASSVSPAWVAVDFFFFFFKLCQGHQRAGWNQTLSLLLRSPQLLRAETPACGSRVPGPQPGGQAAGPGGRAAGLAREAVRDGTNAHPPSPVSSA